MIGTDTFKPSNLFLIFQWPQPLATSPASGGETNLTVISHCPLGGSTSPTSSRGGLGLQLSQVVTAALSEEERRLSGDDGGERPEELLPDGQQPTHNKQENIVMVNNFTHCDDGPFVSHFNNYQVSKII